VEGAGVHHRLAHEADDDLVAAAVLDGEADAGGDRHVPADDAVSAEEVRVAVEEVHRAALAARAAVDAPEELGHDRARRHAARERLPVVAIRGDDVVVVAQHGERAGGDRFLPDVQVAEAADLAERVRLAVLLLEAALQEHRVEQLRCGALGVAAGAWGPIASALRHVIAQPGGKVMGVRGEVRGGESAGWDGVAAIPHLSCSRTSARQTPAACTCSQA
jgi:hypothetical protein